MKKIMLLLSLFLSRHVYAQSTGTDSCSIDTFVKSYAASSGSETFIDILETRDGNYLVSGSAHSADPAGGFDAIVMKVSRGGSIIWQKKYPLNITQSFIQAANTADNGYVFLVNNNQTANTTGSFVIKINGNGTVLWKKALFVNKNIVEAKKIIAASDSSYYVLGSYSDIISDEQASITKLSRDGNLAWSKIYASPVDTVLLLPNDLTEDGNSLIAVGEYYDIYVNHLHSGFAFSVTKSDGSVNWSNDYLFPKTSSPFVQITPFHNQFIVDAYLADSIPNTASLRMNGDGTIDRSEKTKSFASFNFDNQAVSDDGSIVKLNLYNGNSGAQALTLCRYDSAFNMTWTKKYSQYGDVRAKKIMLDQTRHILVAGYRILPGGHSAAQLMKFDEPGNLSACTSTSFDYSLSLPDYSIVPFTFRSVTNLVYVGKTVVLSEVNADLTVTNTDCLSASACDLLYVSGNDVVCNVQDTNIYKALRRPGCLSPVKWTIDTAFAKVVSVTDSTIRLYYVKPGKVKLFGEIGASCNMIQDSIEVSVIDNKPNFSLGPDRAFCRNGINLLHAGPDFVTYTWQDGSTDSVYRIPSEGTYFVKVTDRCERSFSDTVNIAGTQDGPKNFLAAQDSVCSGNPLALHAIGTWAGYNWFDGSTGFSDTVSSAGVYSLQVTDKNGCIATDSILVSAKKNCRASLYFPSAFSPNGDGYNDFFKPIVLRSVHAFSMAIYDRWGQKVFETTSPLNGWNGTLQGKLQNTGVFIWYARYTDSNAQEHTAKGSIYLLR